MRVSTLIGLAAGLASQVVSAACSSALKIDDFSKFASRTNSLGDWTDDDSSMTSISATGGVLSFKPKTSSYFYESFPCQAASSNGYNSVQFTVKGVAGGSFTLELQTKTACSASSYTSKYIQVTGLTSSAQTITVPFTQFTGANTNAITSIVWSGFSSTTATWQLSNIAFGCGGGASTPSSSAVSSIRSSSAVVSSTVRSSSVVVSSSSSVRSSSSSAVASSSIVSSSIRSSSASSFAATSSSVVSSSSRSSSASSFVSSSVAASSSVVSSSSRSSSAASSSSVISSSASSSAVPSSTRISSSAVSSSVSRTTLVTSSSPSASAGTCSPLLIDDWISQSRLTFLFYNAMDYPTSDDGSATSLSVGKPSANHLQIVPKSGTYFYSQFPCVNAKTTKYTGISLRITAPAGSTISVELDSSDSCDPTNAKAVTVTEKDLGWTFNGKEQLYLIPFAKFAGLNTEKLVTILFSNFKGTAAVTFGPMAFYCGTTGEWIVPPAPVDPGSTATVPAPANTAGASLVIDKFASADSNALKFWHGADDGMTLKYASSKLTITSNDSDLAYYTQVSDGCTDFSKYKGSYLHIAYSGTVAFTVSFQQHNSACNPNIAPFPETWDSAEASRYANNGHIYIPLNHFNIEFSRVVGFVLKGFYKPDPITLSVIEIVTSVPAGTIVPAKDQTGSLVFACKRPNSFAFAIDDGTPNLAQDVLKIIRDENIKVTFFTVGAPLLDASTNLTNVYREMQAAGHQLAMHSFTHPKMEGLPDYASIDWEYNNDVAAMKQSFNGFTTSYFRPPFGTEGARMRSRLTKAVGNDATITEWSVDVEDWLWAESSTPEQQKVAFQRDVNAGGNLVVLHYLYPSTVSYLKEFITIAKATGKRLMRVDQCMMDPNAPPLDD